MKCRHKSSSTRFSHVGKKLQFGGVLFISFTALLPEGFMGALHKIFSYFLSAIYWLAFGLLLVVFHPIQFISLKLGGYAAHKRSVEILNIGLLSCIRILGGSFTYTKHADIPENVPVIFASNHQSMMDIPPFVWWCRKHHPKFVSKIELGKGIPSVSYNLRHGGSVLIDRKDPKQSLKALLEFGKYLEENKYSAVIYPEGTRSKNGKTKRR